MFRRQYPWRLPALESERTPNKNQRGSQGERQSEGAPQGSRSRVIAAEGIADYLVYGAALAEDQRYRLSSEVMLWQQLGHDSDQTPASWLWRLAAVADYWHSRAAEHGLKHGLKHELRHGLKHGLKHESEQQKVAGGDWRSQLRQQLPDSTAPAVLCQHPFVGLLILAQMRERQLTGMVDSRDPFGAKLWQQADLQLFFSLCRQLGEQWQQVAQSTRSKQHRFHLPEFTRKLQRWQDFTKKASFQKVADLATLSYPGVRRRYGVFVAQLWQWLFAGAQPQAPGPELRPELRPELGPRFPWQQWHKEGLPTIHRALDYPIANWQGMAPRLAEDITKLSHKMPVSWRALRLKWQVTFMHLETLTIDVTFRHPHSLHSEQPEQATAVQQAQYGFERLMRTLREREDYLDLPQDLPAISWQLSLKDYLTVHQRAIPLWADSHHHEQIAQMENRLKVPLHRYQLTEDFLPEASFRQTQYDNPKLPEQLPRSDCWLQAAIHRPLFISKVIEPWPELQQRYSSQRQFLERVAAKWWQLPVEQWPGAERDYFRAWFRSRDGRQLSAWVFRDGGGRWFCHGYYY